ncbi:MAG: class I SAM-dependent methyltransferase [Acidobacteriota bacterium]|nr:class I SAM-dependent methyltransferase [Acidobacteriota bacterium]
MDGIPRVVEDAFGLFPAFGEKYADLLPNARPRNIDSHPPGEELRRTRESFGYQWTAFSAMVIDFRENFLEYIHPVQPAFFPGKRGLDVGCGFGRHIANAAQFGAEMVGVDISAAIDVTHKNTCNLPNVHLVQADVYRMPFRQGTFDFAYSIGVLHHLPDPEAGFKQLVSVVKSKGAVFIWVYSKKRRLVNAMLETARALTTRLSPRFQMALSWAAAAVDWGGFVVPYRIMSQLPGLGSVVRRFGTPRLKVYGNYPFQVAWADWFDRLAAPIRFYYNENDLNGWLRRSDLSRTLVSPTGLFGWRAYGERDGQTTTSTRSQT